MTVGTVLGGLVGLLLLAAPAQAATTTFTGSVDQDWNTAGNWSAGVPTAADDAVIPTGKAAVLADGASAAARTLLVETGSTLRVAGDIDLTGGVSLSGTLELGGGTLAAPEGVLVESGTFMGPGTVTGDLTNTAGTVAVGASPARLTVTGDYTQGAHGSLHVGSSPGPFPLEDRLSVGGTAAVHGKVWVLGDPAPDLGIVVDVVTASAVTGTFDAVWGYAGAGRHFEAGYPAGIVRVTVVQSPPAPQIVTLPSLPGGAREGESVTCHPGTWKDAERYSFFWLFQMDGVLRTVPWHTATITIPAGESITKVICAVTAHNGVTETGHVLSNHMLVAPVLVNQVAPAVTPAAAGVGDTLTCEPARWAGNGAVTYGWLRDGTPIQRQTALTYVVGEADAGRSLACRSTSTDAVGSASADSNVVAIPARPAPPAPVTPVTPLTPVTPAVPVTVPIGRLATLPAARRCAGPRSLQLRLRDAGARAELFVDGKRVKVVGGKARVTLRRLPKGRWTLKIVSTAANGERRQATRRYRTCAPKKRR